MKKQIVITKLFEFGGSNTHLSLLIRYFGKENILLILEDEEQLKHLENIPGASRLSYKIMPRLHKYAHLVYRSKLSNLKELSLVAKSILTIFFLSIKNGYADVTICAVEPEKHLYFLWLPFVRVCYILHTTPVPRFTGFTSYTCNKRLGDKKKIITVSNATKTTICNNWEINTTQQANVCVVYNCVIKKEPDHMPQPKDEGLQTVLTLGQVIQHKNPELWLKVAEAVTAQRAGTNFIWLGHGPLFEHFREATATNDAISFPGFTNQSESYFKDATVYYQPSLSETQGIAVAEAMSHHLPCVVSNVGGLPESVLDGYNGMVVDPYKIDEHVTALINLLDKVALRDQYCANAYQRYQELFTYDRFKANMDAIYVN